MGVAGAGGGQKLTASDEFGAGEFGFSVAVSADASAVLVGGYKDSGGFGAAWAFSRNGSTWAQDGSKLIAADEHGVGWFGASVAISADGKTALIGIPQDNADTGTARVLTRIASGWTQQAELNSSGDQDALGLSVALSADGNTAVLGAPKHERTVGGAYVFARTGSKWRRLGGILSGRNELRLAEVGDAVGISGDGKTVAIGGPGDDGGAGSVWMFTRSGSRWVPGPKIVPADAIGRSEFGFSLALDSTGQTLVVGGFRDHGGLGAVWVYKRSGAAWTEAKKLTQGPGALPSFGYHVALSSSGDTVLVGGPSASRDAGAAWLFGQSGSTWKQTQRWLGSSHSGLGYGVALSADGKIAAIGAPNDNGGVGSVLMKT
jgi:hypothetical protein